MLKIQSDRVIIDGHEPTKEQCETMTLLANALAGSESFKTVKYESGYAEFEKVRKADELKFPFVPDKFVYVNSVAYIADNGSTGGVSTWGAAIDDQVCDSRFTFENQNILFDGEQLQYNGVNVIRADDIISGGEYTTISTPKVSVDLTTLPGWSSLPSNTYSITIVAKAENYRDSEPSAAVSVTKGAIEYTDCITFTGETSDFTLAVGSNGAKEWDGTVQYSTDHNTWTIWNGTAISSVDKKLYLRGSGNTKFYTNKGAQLSLSARAACSGNIQTLLEYSNPPTSIPVTDCYRNMFYNCRNLTQAPALTVTTLKNGCYFQMFRNCTNLTAAPELPATTLANYCYYYMFYGCTSLVQAPELPATTLANNCYRDMFSGCTSLKISATRSSEYPTAWRIPSSGTISSTATTWNSGMLKNTGGTFTSDPSINTTYYGAWGGQ